MEFRLHSCSGNALRWVVEVPDSCAAVIPCFNEEASIARVVQDALKQVDAVWVVDDGSIDRTATEAERVGAMVIRHEANLGKGASLRDGLQAAHARGYKWAVTLDGDGQHACEDIPQLLKVAAEGADLVIGDRTACQNSMTFARKFVNRWMSARLGKRLGIACPDSQCGFRVVRLDAWAGLTLRQNRFEVESEMLVAFRRAGLRIAWAPVQCLPARRPSRIHPLVDSARWFRWWFATK
jgi:glycosyltransferase involved in cell wall biosynthesis